MAGVHGWMEWLLLSRGLYSSCGKDPKREKVRERKCHVVHKMTKQHARHYGAREQETKHSGGGHQEGEPPQMEAQAEDMRVGRQHGVCRDHEHFSMNYRE